jgi:hypothetical protein
MLCAYLVSILLGGMSMDHQVLVYLTVNEAKVINQRLNLDKQGK